MDFPRQDLTPRVSIPPHQVPLPGCFGGPGASEWDRRRCHRGGERGEAVPAIWHQDTAKKCRLKKKKKVNKRNEAEPHFWFLFQGLQPRRQPVPWGFGLM